MEQDEMMQRVVGILTETTEWVRRGPEDPDEKPEAPGFDELLRELLPPFTLRIPDDPESRASFARFNEELNAALTRLVSSFCNAFAQLALEHDEGHADVSSADVLRRLALAAASESPDTGS